MNRFAILAFVALAAVAIANSAPVDDDFDGELETQASLRTTDDEETANVVNGDMAVFADFCIQSRDFVFADIKAKAGSTSSKGFSYFFSMLGDITEETLNANKDATARLSNQLANPDAEVQGDDTVAQAQRDVSGKSAPAALVSAVHGALAATAQAIVNVASEKFATVASYADPQKALELAAAGCGQIADYEVEAHNQFNEYKKSLPEEAQKKFQRTRFEDVRCVTTSRISRVSGFCSLIKEAYAPIKKAMGYSS